MRRPFRRTPKLASRHRLVAAVAAAAPETALGAALVACAVAAGSLPGHADLTAWRAMLAVMSVPCLSALALSLVSALPERARRARRLPGLGLPRPGSQET